MALVNAFGDIALDASVQEVVVAVESIDDKLPTAVSSLPVQGDTFLPVMQAPQITFRAGFDKTITNGTDPLNVTEICIGSGMARNQASGSLTITSGTTANSETILRSPQSFSGDLIISYSMVASQRIANNNIFYELVDVVGDNLAFTINSTTAVTVTIPSNPFTSQNVGQFIYLGNFTGTAGTIPNRYAIASVSGNDVTFTVASFPASGSGTVSLFGWNYYHVLYTSTTATNAAYGTQRNGWQTADTTVTVNTTASPGHIGIISATDGKSAFHDMLSASGSTATQRGTSLRNVPTDTSNLYFQIRVLNGTTNPASTTTFTTGFYEISNYVSQPVSLNNVGPQATANTLPVAIVGTPAVTVTSGAITATGIAGAAAHDAAISGNPVRIAGRALTANYTAVATGDVADLVTTTVGAIIQKPFSIPDADWSYAAASGGIVNTTTAVTVRAAQAAGIRNYVTSMQVYAPILGAATELAIRDGAGGTVLWRGYSPTAGIDQTIQFENPLRGTAATLLEVVTLTATVTGGVYFNLQGYSAP